MNTLTLRLLDGRSVLTYDDVTSLVAADASGEFGIQPGHVDLLTVLEPGLLRYRRAAQNEWSYAASLGGLLRCVREPQRCTVTIVSSRFVQQPEPEALLREFSALLARESALRVSTRESQAQLDTALMKRLQQLSETAR